MIVLYYMLGELLLVMVTMYKASASADIKWDTKVAKLYASVKGRVEARYRQIDEWAGEWIEESG